MGPETTQNARTTIIKSGLSIVRIANDRNTCSLYRRVNAVRHSPLSDRRRRAGFAGNAGRARRKDGFDRQKTRSQSEVPSNAAATPPGLDLASLETRLRATNAIGMFTKRSRKNQIDDLLHEFEAFH